MPPILLLLASLLSAPALAAAGDGDGDGYTVAEDDCDDTDPAINPGAEEVCDDQDNDCDGDTDESTTWYIDSDDDGFGSSELQQETCEPPNGYVANDDDCDDGDPSVKPGVDEECDEIDNDCDGTIDEDCDDPGGDDTGEPIDGGDDGSGGGGGAAAGSGSSAGRGPPKDLDPPDNSGCVLFRGWILLAPGLLLGWRRRRA